ncbi:TolB family protein [Streptomyces sp. NBC_01361]|uniref:TolB family protein n=1 Tax=Streptomyces sp. NBC_01361 TaxID=2903838 RepID=UPI002E3709EF|nr:hypothetical protein [Streptomyces sp. NBC_01361]
MKKPTCLDLPGVDSIGRSGQGTLDSSLYGWDEEWDYRFCDVFPALSKDGRLAITSKQLGNSSIVTMLPDGSDQKVVFDAASSDLDPTMIAKGLTGAFRPAWSHDGKWIAFGLGGWFQTRATSTAVIARVPVLTTESDNLPDWSWDGKLILFARKTSATNFDVCTIKPDGSDLKILTSSGANDGHAVWNYDGRILHNSGMYGFREEAALYDDTFQPYGQIFSMNADGSDKKMLTDSQWEDSMPLFLTQDVLSQ